MIKFLTSKFDDLERERKEKDELINKKIINKNFHDKKMIFAGDFNLIFDKNLESAGRNPFIKNHSISHSNHSRSLN